MDTPRAGKDFERLKDELHALKRRSAPWYFEETLHQRIHGGKRRRRRFRPIGIAPVLVLAVIVLVLLALAVYVVMLHTNIVVPPGK
ncbi:MAG TPA: hypothetical protein VMM80_11375 [Bacteroidota bacterium]|nr:hypothetical protein [Bacteroidota bacterium]